MICAFKNFIPVVHESSFIHPQACVTGNVIIGKNIYVGPGAAIRGDWGKIIIEDGCNVQENCIYSHVSRRYGFAERKCTYWSRRNNSRRCNW